MQLLATPWVTPPRMLLSLEVVRDGVTHEVRIDQGGGRDGDQGDDAERIGWQDTLRN